MRISHILLSVVFVVSQLQAIAQDKRRENYYETFVELTKPIDSIVVLKSKRQMIVFHKGQKQKMYIISLGMEPEGRKRFEGDLRTPEGLYTIHDRSTKSSYHANLGISYPNAADRFAANFLGMSAGGDIKIHGFPNQHAKQQEPKFLGTDWTVGCIAVSDREVEELYTWVVFNCPILILQ
jgi:murein L,D-transpeptidase YafK